jgi:transposase
VILALRYFRQQVATPLLIICDRLNAHRGREVMDFISAHPCDYAVEYLPAYAPELNPEEQANAWVKQQMANALPASVTELADLARASFRRLQHQPALIRHFPPCVRIVVARPVRAGCVHNNKGDEVDD